MRAASMEQPVLDSEMVKVFDFDPRERERKRAAIEDSGLVTFALNDGTLVDFRPSVPSEEMTETEVG